MKKKDKRLENEVSKNYDYGFANRLMKIIFYRVIVMQGVEKGMKPIPLEEIE